MGVEKKIIKQGNGSDKPKKGDNVTMEYTGWLHEAGKPDNKGNQYGPPSVQQIQSLTQCSGSTPPSAAATLTSPLALAVSSRVSPQTHPAVTASGLTHCRLGRGHCRD